VGCSALNGSGLIEGIRWLTASTDDEEQSFPSNRPVKDGLWHSVTKDAYNGKYKTVSEIALTAQPCVKSQNLDARSDNFLNL